MRSVAEESEVIEALLRCYQVRILRFFFSEHSIFFANNKLCSVVHGFLLFFYSLELY